MYNHARRCLIISMKIHGKFLTQSIHKSVLSGRINYYINHWNDATYKRLCYEVAIKTEDKDETKVGSHNVFQQKLDEFLSDPENKKLYDILQLEIEVLRSHAELVPEKLRPNDWLMLFSKKSKNQRKKYLKFLWKIEKSNENAKAKKDKEKELREAEWQEKWSKTEETEDKIRYGLFQNSLFLRIYPRTINDWYNGRLIRNMMFEPKIVFDCDYEKHMTQSEIHNCAKQLTLSFAANRIHNGAMCLYFCNLNNGLLKQYFHSFMPNLFDDDFPAIVTSQSYLELFPKDQLIYLTPHCHTYMTEYDPDMVYIIGAMVDKSNPLPFSAAKAKKEGIRTVRLPLEKYLSWGSSSTKNLTINQMMNILLDVKHTKSWEKALQNNVPTRKLKAAREYALQQKVEKVARLQAEHLQDSSLPQDTKFNIQTQTDFTFASRKKL